MTVTIRNENGILIWGGGDIHSFGSSLDAARVEAERVYRSSSAVTIVDRLNFEAAIALVESTRTVAELINETNTAPGKLPTQGFSLLTMAADQNGIVNDDVIIFDLANQPILPAILQHNGGGVYEFLGSGEALLRATIGSAGTGTFAREYAWFVNSVEVGIRARTVDDDQGTATHLLTVSIGDTVELRQVFTAGGTNNIMKARTSATIELFS